VNTAVKFGFHKRQCISWLAVKLSASQKKCYFVDAVILTTVRSFQVFCDVMHLRLVNIYPLLFTQLSKDLRASSSGPRLTDPEDDVTMLLRNFINCLPARSTSWCGKSFEAHAALTSLEPLCFWGTRHVFFPCLHTMVQPDKTLSSPIVCYRAAISEFNPLSLTGPLFFFFCPHRCTLLSHWLFNM
jgi:hypothetical protein